MIQHKHVRSTLSPAAALTLLACLLVAGCGDGGGYGGGGSGGGGGDGYGGDPPLPPVSPTIVLTPPAGGSVNRTVNLSASVTAPVGVTRVEFLVDGAGVGTVTTPPYTFAWDTSASPMASTA